MNSDDRLLRFRIDVHDLAMMMQGRFRFVEAVLPADAEVRSIVVRHDTNPSFIDVVIYSGQFAPVPAGGPIPAAHAVIRHLTPGEMPSVTVLPGDPDWVTPADPPLTYAEYNR